jgi:hypothetical protein
MTNTWKALAIGIVGAIGGLGAVSLTAQERAGTGGDLLLKAGQDGVWHVSGGRLRHCRYNTTYDSMYCTAWQ